MITYEFDGATLVEFTICGSLYPSNDVDGGLCRRRVGLYLRSAHASSELVPVHIQETRLAGAECYRLLSRLACAWSATACSCLCLPMLAHAKHVKRWDQMKTQHLDDETEGCCQGVLSW